jgi:hypothetical protein
MEEGRSREPLAGGEEGAELSKGRRKKRSVAMRHQEQEVEDDYCICKV